MPTFTATRGINCRRYFTLTIEADTAEEAFETAKGLMTEDHAGKWVPDVDKSTANNALGHVDDLYDPAQGADETLSIDESGEIVIDFTDVPTETEPACFADLMAFVKRMALMTTPEEEFAAYPDGYASAEEFEENRKWNDLFAEYQMFMHMVREAKALLQFPKEA